MLTGIWSIVRFTAALAGFEGNFREYTEEIEKKTRAIARCAEMATMETIRGSYFSFPFPFIE